MTSYRDVILYESDTISYQGVSSIGQKGSEMLRLSMALKLKRIVIVINMECYLFTLSLTKISFANH